MNPLIATYTRASYLVSELLSKVPTATWDDEAGVRIPAGSALSDELRARVREWGKRFDVDDPRRYCLDRRALRLAMLCPENFRESLAIPVPAFVGLPYPYTLELFTRVDGYRAVVTSHRASAEKATAEGVPVFVAAELEVMAWLFELDHLSGSDFKTWTEAKSRGQWRLTPERAGLAAMPHWSSERRPWGVPLGAVLDAIEADVVRADVFERAESAAKGAA